MRRFGLLARALLVYGVALALRFRNVRAALAGDHVFFGSGDSYYHLRRVLLTLQQFPEVPHFDAYVNFPEGARITWPPGFDLFVATVCWVVGLGHPSRHAVELTAALLVPFLGAITAVVVLLLAEEILGRGRWEALAAGLLFAFLPAHQQISTVGRLDHPVIEMTAFGTAVLFFLRAIRDDPGSRYSFWGGLALAAGVFCWAGSVLYAGFLAGVAILQMILDRCWGRPDGGGSRSALRVLFWGSLFLLPLVVLTPGGSRTSLTSLFLSWYQPALIGLGAFLVASLSGAIFAPSDRRGRRRAVRGFVLSGLLLAGVAVLMLRAGGSLDLPEGRVRVAALAAELSPAWKLPRGQLVHQFSYLVYLAPLAALAQIWLAVRARFGDVRDNTLLALFFFTAVLGAANVRFLNYFAVPFCVVMMWAFREVLAGARGSLASRPLRWSATAACALLVAVPLGKTLRASMHSLPGNLPPALDASYPSLEWMRDRTPRTSDYLKPDGKPEYGVLADCAFGHWITAVAERPNFCNPFHLAPWHAKPILESALFYLSEEEGLLLDALDRNRLRYVLVFDLEASIPEYARLAKRRPADYLVSDPATGRSSPAPRLFRTLMGRLALADGSEVQAGADSVPALTGFRLVHESPEIRSGLAPGPAGDPRNPRVKIFERVPGARLEGSTDPGSEVRVDIQVTTDAGRAFPYTSRTPAAADGIFSVVVPYATGTSGNVSASAARVTTSKCVREIALTEAEVLGGARRTVPCS